MENKIKILGVLAICMLVTLSLTTVVSSNKTKDTKESPLYKIRAKRVISERLTNLIEQIKTKFIGDRMFFNLLEWFKTGLLSRQQSKYIDPAWIITAKLDCGY